MQKRIRTTKFNYGHFVQTHISEKDCKIQWDAIISNVPNLTQILIYHVKTLMKSSLIFLKSLV